MTRINTFEVITNPNLAETAPLERDPAQWNQAIGVARDVCARIFRDGGKPADAIATFGIAHATADRLDWSRAVTVIADSMCAIPVRKAA